MKIFRLSHPHDLKKEEQPSSSCAIGFFDGVHRGHQRVILTAKEIAGQKGLTSAVMTFHPHPSVILNKNKKHVSYITPLEDKLNLIKKLGIERTYVVTFTPELANLMPEAFVEQFLIGLNIRHLVSGFDFTYGKMGKGSIATIEEHARGEFDYTVIEKVTEGEGKISSTKIRELLSQGNIEEANQLLGRPFQINGKVIKGDQRGRTIGFPTANIQFNKDYLIPKIGVYAVKVYIEDQEYHGMANIGYKPTFYDHQLHLSLEVNIFNFDGNIYDKPIKVEFHRYIRSEKKFTGIEDLKKQLQEDQANIQHFFSASL
ncbi:MAG: riboflavin biosynthesis protein RibF [Bacillaceae bacterium]|nr:riboflavin biosynthesis protein RibF [Bacillaceae bacterium]